MYNSLFVFRVFSFFVFFLSVISCDLTEPNNRFFNENTTPFQSTTLDITEIKPGKHIAGSFWFEMNLDSIEGQIQRVDLYVDSSLMASTSNPPYLFYLDTYQWSEGEHLIIVTVLKKGPNAGLLGAVGVPSIVYSASVVFDQTPPTPVVLESVTWENGHPRLFWTRNNDANFYAYIISQEGNWGPGNPNTVGAGIDTIVDQSITTYLDSSISPIYGLHVFYNVFVNNRAEYVSSNEKDIYYGDTIPVYPLSSFYDPRPIVNPNRDEMYVYQTVGDHSLKAVSTVTNTVIRSRGLYNFRTYALSKDGTELYIVQPYVDSLITIEASTFNTTATAALSFASSINSIVAGRTDRLYMVLNYINSGIKIMNPNTGAEVGEILINVSDDGLLAISPDNNTLYIANSTDVYKVDITTDTGQVISHKQSPYDVSVMQLSPDGQRLYLGYGYTAPPNFFDIWDTIDMTSIAQISAPTPGWFLDFFVTSSHIYLSYFNTSTDHRQVVQYDAGSLTLLKFWDFVSVPRLIVVSRDDHYLYAFDDDKSFVIQLF